MGHLPSVVIWLHGSQCFVYRGRPFCINVGLAVVMSINALPISEGNFTGKKKYNVCLSKSGMIPVVRDLLVVSTKGGRTSVATNFGTNEYLVCIQSDRTQVVWWACTSLDWSIVSSEFKKIESIFTSDPSALRITWIVPKGWGVDSRLDYILKRSSPHPIQPVIYDFPRRCVSVHVAVDPKGVLYELQRNPGLPYEWLADCVTLWRWAKVYNTARVSDFSPLIMKNASVCFEKCEVSLVDVVTQLKDQKRPYYYEGPCHISESLSRLLCKLFPEIFRGLDEITGTDIDAADRVSKGRFVELSGFEYAFGGEALVPGVVLQKTGEDGARVEQSLPMVWSEHWSFLVQQHYVQMKKLASCKSSLVDEHKVQMEEPASRKRGRDAEA